MFMWSVKPLAIVGKSPRGMEDHDLPAVVRELRRTGTLAESLKGACLDLLLHSPLFN